MQLWATVCPPLCISRWPVVGDSCCQYIRRTKQPDQQMAQAGKRALLRQGLSQTVTGPCVAQEHSSRRSLCVALLHRLGSLLQHSLQEAVQGSHSSFRSFSQVCCGLCTLQCAAAQQQTSDNRFVDHICLLLTCPLSAPQPGSSTGGVRGQEHQSHLPGPHRQERQLPHRAGEEGWGANPEEGQRSVARNGVSIPAASSQAVNLLWLPVVFCCRPSRMARKWWAAWCPKRAAARTSACLCSTLSAKPSRRLAATRQSSTCHRPLQQQPSWRQSKQSWTWWCASQRASPSTTW